MVGEDKGEGNRVRRTVMKIAFEITMPVSNNTENVAQYLIMQKQHQHNRVSRKRMYDCICMTPLLEL
jgi:hypothetical protein